MPVISVNFAVDLRNRYGDPQPEDFVHRFSGDICVTDADQDEETVIGKMEIILFEIAAGERAGFDPFTIVDSFDHESAQYGGEIFDFGGRVTKNVQRVFPDLEGFIDRVLVLETMKIEPEYRGRNYGLAAASTAIEFFGQDALVVLKPFPLQFSGCVKESNENEFKRARRKLIAYWKKLGTVKFGDNGHLARCGADDLPTFPHEFEDEESIATAN